MASQSVYSPILLQWSSNFQNNFCLSKFANNLGHFVTNLRPHNQNSFFNIFLCFLFLALGYLETCVNGFTICETPKRALVPLLPGEMKLDIYLPSQPVFIWMRLKTDLRHHIKRNSHFTPLPCTVCDEQLCPCQGLWALWYDNVLWTAHDYLDQRLGQNHQK